MHLNQQALSKLAATIRVIAAEAVEKAKSGHPGMPMGAADYTALLWSYYLRFNPDDPQWIGRDRFVLSAGHGSMLLYTLLHLFGFSLSLDDIKSFRQWGSKTPGHPEYGHTDGVETTTGPLGQGFANGVGLALSAKMLGAKYSPLFAHRVFGVVSDGDIMEGLSAEAASLAGHWRLNNLIYLYDDNGISIGGKLGCCFSENVPQRFEACGWYVQRVDGHDAAAVQAALDKALLEADRPSLICARTVIGKGSPRKADTADSHGAPLGEDEVKRTKDALAWPLEPPFYIPEEVYEFCRGRVEEKRAGYREWQAAQEKWQASTPEAAAALAAQISGAVPETLRSTLVETIGKAPADATRNISGKAIQVIAQALPWFLGGSADLEPSNKTPIQNSHDLAAPDYRGRNLRFGVREHAMTAIVNGLAYTKMWLPYTGTFLVFADYMRPAVRLAALARLRSIFIFSHDSFYVGEDGPTHQPIEHIGSLRMIPNLRVYRPADGLEVALCYWSALRAAGTPSVLLFSRQKLPVFQRDAAFADDDILRGGYIIQGRPAAACVIAATGSEVSLALEASKLLEKAGLPARVVSMPCVELFLEQEQAYRDQVIPPGVPCVSIEAASTFGWERITGSEGLRIGWDDFGRSAPAEVLGEKFGFTPEAVSQRVREWLLGASAAKPAGRRQGAPTAAAAER